MVDSTVVIANMNSKSNRQDKSKVKKMEKAVGHKGEVIRTHNQEELIQAIHYVLKYQPDVLYPSGGDGGHLTVNTIFREEQARLKEQSYNPLRAASKEGTWNLIAKHAGNKKGTSIGYLEYIVKTELDDLATLDVGEMKVSDDTGKVTYGFSFGFGMPITLLEEAYKAKYMKAVRVAQVIGQLLWSAARHGEYYKMFAEKKNYFVTNGNREEEEVSLLGLMAQTVPGLGLPWSHVFYKALDADKFHIMGAKHDILELTALAPALYFGKTKHLKADLPFSELDVGGALALLPALYTGDTSLFDATKFINKQTDFYKIRALEPFPYQMNGDMAFMGDPFMAEEIVVEGGYKSKIIKHLI